jgi:hypothetical protein
MTYETTLFLVFGSALLFVCAIFYKIGRLAVLMTFFEHRVTSRMWSL